MLTDEPSVLAVVAFGIVTLIIAALVATFRPRARQLRLAHDEARASAERWRLLASAGAVLASSLDYETTVATIARLAVPDFSDWCSVDLLVGDEIKRLAAKHCDPTKEAQVHEVDLTFPPNPAPNSTVLGVIRTGQPFFATVVTDQMLIEAARGEEHLAMLRSVGVYSAIVVPIVAREATQGALTLVSSHPARRFSHDDFTTAQELARRAATAIDNARLYQATQAANATKANFLAAMSHELRTPLTAIIGFDELLLDGIDGPITEAQRRPLERIKASANQLQTLIDEMFLFARLEAGDEEVRIEAAPVKGVLDDVVRRMSSTAEKRGLTLRAEAVDPNLTVDTDAAKLRQILCSLVSNAIRFTLHGGIVIRAGEQYGKVTVEVEDTGIGIEPQNLERIFDPFWQVEQTTTRKTGGSGLGLTVARRLAKLLHGDISVVSTPSVGSTFRLVLTKYTTRPGTPATERARDALASGEDRTSVRSRRSYTAG
jgi:signal transduction histidine kinase